MNDFEIRTTPVKYGEEPWDWNATYLWQCTWFVYWRFYQVFGLFPCYYKRSTREEGYTTAKLWGDNYKDAIPHWFSKEPNIEFKRGDIIVFDGNYGHVVFVEDVVDRDTCFISQYNLSNPNEFSNDYWVRGGILKGHPYNTGSPLCLMRCEAVVPVERNEMVDQVYVNEPTLRVRCQPNLNGEFYCNCPTGFFDVLSQSEADGYKWYEIADGKYIADIGWDGIDEGVLFFKGKDDTELYVKQLVKTNKELKKRLDKIKEIASYE